MQRADGSGDDDLRHVPLVIRNAVARSRALPQGLALGYSPAVAVDLVRAHCWAPYDAVAAALRSLAQLSLVEKPAREAARAAIAGLFRQDLHPTPFDAGRRFPEGEVYVCLDRGPFGQQMYWIQQELLRVEAAAGQYTYRIILACESYMRAVKSAAETLTQKDDAHAPVMYDRDIFEAAFLLSWTDA